MKGTRTAFRFLLTVLCADTPLYVLDTLSLHHSGTERDPGGHKDTEMTTAELNKPMKPKLQEF